MSETNLLPCPFCDCEAEVYEYEKEYDVYDKDTLGYVDTEYYIKYGVGCSYCGCIIAEQKNTESAISAWNTRKPMERIVERLEEQKMREYLMIANTSDGNLDFIYTQIADNLDAAIDIVKEEGGLNG